MKCGRFFACCCLLLVARLCKGGDYDTTIIQSSDEPVRKEPPPFLLCDFSGSDLCNWRPRDDGDLARWETYSLPLDPYLEEGGLPESTAESFAYVARGTTQSSEDRQANLITTPLWPASAIGCLKFQLWLHDNGDELSVTQVFAKTREKLIYAMKAPTKKKWLPVQIEVETVGSYHFIFNGTIAQYQVNTLHSVAITKIQLFPYPCLGAEIMAENFRRSNSKVQLRSTLNTLSQAYAGGLWENNRVPYYINIDTNQAKSFGKLDFVRVQAAINDLNVKLPQCIQFVPVLFNATKDFLYIIYDASRECWSDGIGRLGGIQVVRLNFQCLTKRGAIQRILLHAVGLYSEHDRADRDNYISIQPQNIVYWAQQYFVLPPVNSSQVQYPSPNAPLTWGLPYDISSLMHFGQWNYSYDGARKTIEIKNPPGNVDQVVGQREGMSIQDINKIFLLYGCDMANRLLPNVTCFNGGTPAGYYFCICPPLNATASFSGLRCETPICERSCGKSGGYYSPNNCVPGDNPGDPNKCVCGTGYTGKWCESYLCSPACENEGLCTGPNTCTCREGYNGYRCDNAICNLPCLNGGTCLTPDFCACPYGFRGPQCQFGTCYKPCQNGGSCTGLNACTCAPGFSGLLCEFDLLSTRKNCSNYNISDISTTSTTTTPFPLYVTGSTTPAIPRIIETDCASENEYCAKFPGCPDVAPIGACLCKFGFSNENGTCKRRVFLGDSCTPWLDHCFGGAECIDYTCQCNPYKGLVPRYASNTSAFYSFCIKAMSTVIRSQECIHSEHCKPPMVCEANLCKCPYDYQFFDPALQTCVLHGVFGGTCDTSQLAQCKALGPNGYCSGYCACQSGKAIPYWGNATEMATGQPRFICGQDSDIQSTLGGECSSNFNIPGSKVCNLTLFCVKCPFTGQERCAIQVNMNMTIGVLKASRPVEPMPLLVVMMLGLVVTTFVVTATTPHPHDNDSSHVINNSSNDNNKTRNNKFLSSSLDDRYHPGSSSNNSSRANNTCCEPGTRQHASVY